MRGTIPGRDIYAWRKSNSAHRVRRASTHTIEGHFSLYSRFFSRVLQLVKKSSPSVAVRQRDGIAPYRRASSRRDRSSRVHACVLS